MIISSKLLGMLTVAMALAVGPAAEAAVTVFGFEGESTGTGLTSLTISQAGLTITITRPAADTFGIADISPSVPSWGARTLEPFSGGTQGTAFLVNFSQAVSAVSIEAGDFNADFENGTQEIRAFAGLDAGGAFLGLGSGVWGDGDIGTGDPPMTLSVAAAGIRSIAFVGGSTEFPQSLYWDNLSVTFDQRVPLPGTLLLLGAGLVVAQLRRARRA